MVWDVCHPGTKLQYVILSPSGSLAPESRTHIGIIVPQFRNAGTVQWRTTAIVFLTAAERLPGTAGQLPQSIVNTDFVLALHEFLSWIEKEINFFFSFERKTAFLSPPRQAWTFGCMPYWNGLTTTLGSVVSVLFEWDWIQAQKDWKSGMIVFHVPLWLVRWLVNSNLVLGSNAMNGKDNCTVL